MHSVLLICYTGAVGTTDFKCHFCPVCDGTGCIGEMPGMGGVRRNENFRLNCTGWEAARNADPMLVTRFLETTPFKPRIRLAPVTGAIENIGFMDEQPFYYSLLFAAYKAGLALSIGDGTPDIKIQSGIGAVTQLQKQDEQARSAVFIKPYDNDRIFERVEWSQSVAEVVGIDIDSYNIVTMRNLVHLEKKTAAQLKEIKRRLRVPFAIKGVFCEEDIALVKEVHPDIVYISNHGGRIDTRTGSTAEFLAQHAAELQANCDHIWVDGGIRTATDVATALALGAQQVLIGRPCITALCKDGTDGVRAVAESLRTM